MANGDGEVKGVAESGLKLVLPCPGPSSVAAPTVGKDEQALRLRVSATPLTPPPPCERIDRKRGRVMGCTDEDGSTVGLEVKYAVGHRHSGSVTAEVMVVDEDRSFLPGRSGILELPDQFLLLGIDADDRQLVAFERLSSLLDL